MKHLFIIFSFLVISSELFAAKALTEENITKTLDAVKIAKEHKNINALRKHFTSRASISMTEQNIESSDTKRLTMNEYKRYLSKKWRKMDSNLIEVKERKFSIESNNKTALVKTTLVQTEEVEGVKTATTIYETLHVKLIKGKIYISYYSARKMLNTSMKVN
jgi:hypothetical protein